MTVPLITAPLLAARAVHGFTTRAGGVSEGALTSLNLAPREGETADRLAENWRRVAASVGVETSALALMSQVHGADVATVDAGRGPNETIGAFDAAVTRTPGVALVVRTADCVPVLLAAPSGAVGVAHAGWRGAAANVIPATVRALCALAGCAPADIIAAIGPAISARKYEVGNEVVDALAETGPPRSQFVHEGPRKSHVDVAEVVAHQLRTLGAQFERVERCTAEPEFYSHRHEGPITGRQAGVIVCSSSR